MLAQLPQASGDKKAELEQDILNLKKGRNILAPMIGEEPPYPEVKLSDGDIGDTNLSKDQLEGIEARVQDISNGNILTDESSISTGSTQADHWLKNAVKKVTANPDLLLYKLKANGYKFAWLLIPISLPFVWLTLIGRRGFHFYDHVPAAAPCLSDVAFRGPGPDVLFVAVHRHQPVFILRYFARTRHFGIKS